MAHNPTPWSVENESDFINDVLVEWPMRIVDDNGKRVISYAEFYGPLEVQKVNSNFIVTAVNSHDALVEALKAVLTEATLQDPFQDDDGRAILERAHAALALAEPK